MSSNGYSSSVPLMENFVGGKFQTSNGPIIGNVTNPATGQVLRQVPGSLKEEVCPSGIHQVIVIFE